MAKKGTNFTTILTDERNRPDKPVQQTRILDVGNAVNALAHKRDAILAGKTDTVKCVTNKHKGDGANEIQALINAMVISLVTKKNGKWTNSDDYIGPDAMQEMTEELGLTFKFVFEEPGDAIIVVSNKDVLDFGVTVAPMQEASVYNDLAAASFANSLLENLDAMFENVTTVDQAKGVIQGALEVISQGSGQAPATTYFQQLGAYSVRQCM